MPDRALADFLRRGMSLGFRVSFSRSTSLRGARGNLPSVEANPAAVRKYIEEELKQSTIRLARPEESVHISPIGLIPKGGQTGKFRLIVDLSSPQGASVNDGIDPDLCSLSYSSVDEAVARVRQCGPGALMAKLDLQSAYRKVPVHPDDQLLLGMACGGRTFCDRALPFGLRSAPKLFTAVADGLSWALHCEGTANLLHYLDDFFFWSEAGSSDCANALSIAVPLCGRLGLPVAPQKVVGPTTSIVFLGILFDSVRQEIRLPKDKLARLRTELRTWGDRRAASKRQLQSLIGLLNHAAKVVRPGRPFLRSLIDTMKVPRRQDQKVRLNIECRGDIVWWQEFLSAWNGVGFFPGGPLRATVYSDASGSWGCGAFSLGSAEWLQLPWPASWIEVPIAAKEAVPIVASLAVWGNRWVGGTVQVFCDNMAVVQCLRTGSARDPRLNHLFRVLALLLARFEVSLRAEHIAGLQNGAADTLSRNNAPLFFSLFPQAPRCPTVVPDWVSAVLLDLEGSWTSKVWMARLGLCLSRVCRPVLGAHTQQEKEGTCCSAPELI